MVKAKKQFGQNFLKDTSVLTKIIQSMPQNDNALVEIGPGLGDLTQKLLEVKPVRAYEVDDELSALLKKTFKDAFNEGRLDLQETDVLEAWKQKTSLSEQAYDLVANLPYYIATTIILNALKDKKCKSMTVMIQKEVAEKFAANVGDKEYSALSILAQTLGTAKILFDVPPEAFDPVPKVTSSVIQINKRREFVSGENALFSDEQTYCAFEQYLKEAFKSPRKTMAKNLSSHYDKQVVLKFLETQEIQPAIRPHQLDAATHHHLFNELTKVIDNGREQ